MTNNAEREGFEKWAMGTYSIKRHYGLPDQYAAIAVQVAWGAWQARAQASGVPDESTEPRFFIDHGMIHDRDTGKHVTCEPDEQNLGDCNGTGEDVILKNPDGITATLNLLNELHRAATPTPPKSASVPVERLEALQQYSGDAFGVVNGRWILAPELAELIAECK
jgi:hypothetical protein